MAAQGGGAIVNTSSILGLVGFSVPPELRMEESNADGPAYIASKHGVVGLTKQFALEYGSASPHVYMSQLSSPSQYGFVDVTPP